MKQSNSFFGINDMKTILKQSDSVCNIILNNTNNNVIKYGTGFLCKFFYLNWNEYFYTLITTFHLLCEQIKNDEIKI